MILFFGLFLTIIAYFICVKSKKPQFIQKLPPIFYAGILIILFLKLFNIDYSTYNKGASFFTFLLGPATIALAFPLVENIEVLTKHKRAVWAGLFCATILTIISTVFVARVFNLSFAIIMSMVPKSVTTPIAVEISKYIGGVPELTACIVILTGLLGSLAGHTVLKVFKVNHDVAVGLSIGATSHVLGTVSCIDKNENKQAAVSTLALIVVGVMTSILAPILINFMGLVH